VVLSQAQGQLYLLRIAANILNQQSWTADRR